MRWAWTRKWVRDDREIAIGVCLTSFLVGWHRERGDGSFSVHLGPFSIGTVLVNPGFSRVCSPAFVVGSIFVGEWTVRLQGSPTSFLVGFVASPRDYSLDLGFVSLEFERHQDDTEHWGCLLPSIYFGRVPRYMIVGGEMRRWDGSKYVSPWDHLYHDDDLDSEIRPGLLERRPWRVWVARKISDRPWPDPARERRRAP